MDKQTATKADQRLVPDPRPDPRRSTPPDPRAIHDEGRIVAHENIGGDYEATVENLSASLLVHEWYSHGIKGYGDANNNHRLAY